jgi:hypothetical protein
VVVSAEVGEASVEVQAAEGGKGDVAGGVKGLFLQLQLMKMLVTLLPAVWAKGG